MNIIQLIYYHHRRPFLLMCALTILSGLLGIATLAYINQRLLSQIGSNPHTLWQFALIVGLYFVASTAAQTKLAQIGQSFICHTQTQLFKRILDTPEVQIHLIGKPRILAALANDIRSLSIAFTRLPELAQGVLFVLACSLYLIHLSPKLFAIIVIMLTIMVVGSHYAVKGHYQGFQAMRSAEDAIQDDYQTALDGHKELQLNRYRAEHLYQQFSQQAQSRRHHHTQADAYHALAINWGNAIMLATVGIIFYLARVYQWASLTDAATIAMTLLFMRAPLTAAIGAMPTLMQSQVALNAINALTLAPHQPQFHSETRLPENWQEIRLEKVCYTHPIQGGQSFSLEPISLTLKRGETIFLIGANGSGKSTLSMLLCGLYAPQSGTIYVDNIAIDEHNRAAYRALFSAVFTDFHLFSQLLGKAEQLAEHEKIHYWLEQMQLQEKAKIDQGQILNSKLSQGQRKRLALLLALIEERPILILDEWAADQDPQFRRTFYEILLPLIAQHGHTIFAISHDDKYFHHASRILRMHEGKLSEPSASNAAAIVNQA